jgi:hypothetical protein
VSATTLSRSLTLTSDRVNVQVNPLEEACVVPIYYAKTFEKVVEYIPLCHGFENVYIRSGPKHHPTESTYFIPFSGAVHHQV